MKIWDVPLETICSAHLKLMFSNCRVVWSVLTKPNKWLNNHSEVLRWEDKLNALKTIHDAVQDEMTKRGLEYTRYILTTSTEDIGLVESPDTIKQQQVILLNAQCPCPLKG
mgnify:CR=1 FL=1